MKTIHRTINKIGLKAPYDERFINRIKEINGVFNNKNKKWYVDITYNEVVDEILDEIYGYSDDAELVNVQVTIDFNNSKFSFNDDKTRADFMNKNVLYMNDRNRIKTNNCIEIISGEFDVSADSIKFNEDFNFIFIIKDVYKPYVERYLSENPSHFGFIEIIDNYNQWKVNHLNKKISDLQSEISMLSIEVLKYERLL